MIELYAAPTSNGLRAKIMLDECGLEYKLHRIDLAKGENRTPEFLAMNPMGLIPVLVDDNGPEGRCLTLPQSVAILFYLGEKAGKFIQSNPAKKPVFYDAVMNAATDVSAALAALIAIVRSDTPDQPARDIFEGRLMSYFSVWSKILDARRYCAGDDVTIADFILFSVHVRCGQLFPKLVADHSSLARWATEIGARPGVKRGLQFG
jgi:GST-like protein